MQTIRLKYPDRQTALLSLTTHGLVRVGDDDIPTMAIVGGVRVDIVEIGEILRPTGATILDADGEPVAEMAAIPGFHIDLLWHGDDPPPFGEAIVEPAAPTHTFAI